MRNFYLIGLAVAVFIPLLACVPALAQGEEVQVQQITFRVGPGLPPPFPATPSFRMHVLRSNGEPIIYQGYGDALENQITNCRPCQIPNTFSSNVYQWFQFPGGSVGMTYQWGSFQSGKYVRIHVDQVTSSPFVIDPRRTWKPHEIFKRVSTSISGRVEVFDENGAVVSYDNAFEVHGVTDAYFALVNIEGSRALEFEALISILTTQQ